LETHRATRQRKIVEEYFKSADAFVSIRQVHENVVGDVGTRSVGLSTVYRTVHLLVATGRLDVRVSKSGAKQFRRCSYLIPHCHLVCRRCGYVVEVEPPGVRNYSNPVSDMGFTDITCRVELTGLCPSCRALTLDRGGALVLRGVRQDSGGVVALVVHGAEVV